MLHFQSKEHAFHQIQRDGELQIRKEYPNVLSDHLVQKGETWCHFPNVYGTLEIDSKLSYLLLYVNIISISLVYFLFQFTNVHRHNYMVD